MEKMEQSSGHKIVIQGWENLKKQNKAHLLCQESVEIAAKSLGFEYNFINKDFFSLLDHDIRYSENLSVLAKASIARNLWAAYYLKSGYSEVIWVDSDVPIKNYKALDVRKTFHATKEANYYFQDGRWHLSSAPKATNSVVKYTSKEEVRLVLDLQSLKYKNAWKKDYITKTAMGTDVYTNLWEFADIPLFPDVTFLTVLLKKALMTYPDKFELYKQQTGNNCYALNLGGSLLDDNEMLKVAKVFLNA